MPGWPLGLGGVALIAMACMGATRRLKRNRWIGVRLPSTMASDDAWERAHRASAVPLALAGLVMLSGGVALELADLSDERAARLSGSTGLVTIVCAVIGAWLAHRAARRG